MNNAKQMVVLANRLSAATSNHKNENSNDEDNKDDVEFDNILQNLGI